nr:cation:proton antiporter [Desulfurococcales archaeon]
MAAGRLARRLLTGGVGVALAAASAGAPLYCPPSCLSVRELYPLAVASGIVLSGFLLGEALGVVPAIVEIILGLAAASLGVGVSPTLETLALLGSSFLMFAAGMEVDAGLLARHLLSSAMVGLASFAAPMAATMGALALLGYTAREAALAAVGASTTSVAVVYAILRARGLLSRGEGQVVLASAMVADVASILAFIALAAQTSKAMAAYFLSLFLVPPVLRALFRWLPEQSHEAEM